MVKLLAVEMAAVEIADFEIEKDEMLCNQKNHFKYFIGDNLFKLEQNLKQKTKFHGKLFK